MLFLLQRPDQVRRGHAGEGGQRGQADISYTLAMEMTSELLLLEMVNRVSVCWFEVSAGLSGPLVLLLVWRGFMSVCFICSLV